MKVAILWLINEKGEILMARRADHMSTDAGVWGPSVSGKVDAGESFEQAAIREAHEELGLSTSTLKPIYLHSETYTEHSDGKPREFGLFYSFVPNSIQRHLKLEPNEVTEVKWFKRAQLEQLVSAKSNKLIISSANTLWQSIFSYLSPVTN